MPDTFSGAFEAIKGADPVDPVALGNKPGGRDKNARESRTAGVGRRKQVTTAVSGPAVEAQAIDRSHRIGQTKPVFAYRLIARRTVEEKVLALQQGKRELADAILGGDNRLITALKREDLELLLS